MEKYWNLKEVHSLEDKIIIVTGGNSGIGFEATQIFAKKGATVILACRSLERGTKAKNKILSSYPKAKIELIQLDLGDLASVKTFAKTFTSKYNQLDILLNNAGMITDKYGTTIDGFEQQMGVNYIGPFALTGHLFDTLKATPKSRIVNISSIGHKFGSVDLDNLLYTNKYSALKVYGSSKLANLLFTYELNRRVKNANLNMKVLAAHPGASNTNLTKYIDNMASFKIIEPIMNIFLQDAYQGALPGVRAALDKNAKGGMYFGPDGFIEAAGEPILVKSRKLARNAGVGKDFFD